MSNQKFHKDEETLREDDYREEEDYWPEDDADIDAADYWLDEEEPETEDVTAAEKETDLGEEKPAEEETAEEDGSTSAEAEDDGEEQYADKSGREEETDSRDTDPDDGDEEEAFEEYGPEEEEPEDEEPDDDGWYDEDEDKEMQKKRKKRKQNRGTRKPVLIAGGVIAAVAVIYLGFSVYFMSHFYFNTEINGHNFSGSSAKAVEAYMEEQVEQYTLTVVEKDNQSDTINGSDIDLAYEAGDEIQEALKSQNGFLWPTGLFSKKSTQITIEVTYDADKLETAINNLKSVRAEQTQPVSAYPKYDGNTFVIEPEVLGNAVDSEVLHEKISQYITEFRPELDMEEEGCYALPKYTSDSPEVQAACDEMNKCLTASITYTMDENVVVDKELIATWLTVDENMNVTFNETAVREWLTAFGDKYDTQGTVRTITTPTGKVTEVPGTGTYGWSIDEDSEYTALTTSIKNGETVTKEPAYYAGGTAASHSAQDWGTTYAEVDISAQHMWYIVDGAVVLETDVVTGYPSPEKETTAGAWTILEKSLNKTLVGDIDPDTGKPQYETPVDYWMRITWTGIGFHDADWQPSFGGTLYMDENRGSHGCINMPDDKAAELYDLIEVGTPVLVHY